MKVTFWGILTVFLTSFFSFLANGAENSSASYTGSTFSVRKKGETCASAISLEHLRKSTEINEESRAKLHHLGVETDDLLVALHPENKNFKYIGFLTDTGLEKIKAYGVVGNTPILLELEINEGITTVTAVDWLQYNDFSKNFLAETEESNRAYFIKDPWLTKMLHRYFSNLKLSGVSRNFLNNLGSKVIPINFLTKRVVSTIFVWFQKLEDGSERRVFQFYSSVPTEYPPNQEHSTSTKTNTIFLMKVGEESEVKGVAFELISLHKAFDLMKQFLYQSRGDLTIPDKDRASMVMNQKFVPQQKSVIQNIWYSQQTINRIFIKNGIDMKDLFLKRLDSAIEKLTGIDDFGRRYVPNKPNSTYYSLKVIVKDLTVIVTLALHVEKDYVLVDAFYE